MDSEATSPSAGHEGGDDWRRAAVSAVGAGSSTTLGELVAEFLGTFVLIAFGDGAVAMVVAALNQSGRGKVPFAAEADWLLIAWGWGLAVAFARVRGRRRERRAPQPGRDRCPGAAPRLPVGQGAGLLAPPRCSARSPARALVYLNYHDAIGAFDHAQHMARGSRQARCRPTRIFATFPAPYFHSLGRARSSTR